MNRLIAGIRWDIVRQFRSGFYYASAFFALIWAAVFLPLPQGTINFQYLLPAVLLTNLIAIGFYYISALVLLEKGEGSLTSVVVTPLRISEYLLSKVISLTLLATFESLLVILLIYGFDFRPLLLLLGLILLCAIYVLVGFIAVVPYASINSYLLPSILIVTALILPLIGYFGIWESPIFNLHPLQPALTLLNAAFNPATTAEIIYGLLGSIFWITLAFLRATRLLKQFVVKAA